MPRDLEESRELESWEVWYDDDSVFRSTDRGRPKPVGVQFVFRFFRYRFRSVTGAMRTISVADVAGWVDDYPIDDVVPGMKPLRGSLMPDEAFARVQDRAFGAMAALR